MDYNITSYIHTMHTYYVKHELGSEQNVGCQDKKKHVNAIRNLHVSAVAYLWPP